MKKLQLLTLAVSIATINATQCSEQKRQGVIDTIGRVVEISTVGIITALAGAWKGNLSVLKAGALIAMPLTSILVAKDVLKKGLSHGYFKSFQHQKLLFSTIAQTLGPTAIALVISHLYTIQQNNKALINE